MKVSLNTVQQYIDFDLPPVDELVSRINQQLGGVEEVIDLGAKYKDAQIVKVVECGKHPDADKLSVCRVDAGTGELIQIVCGANNVHADMWAVWLPPESTVPNTFDDAEPFVLSARELRGVMSNGMLASARELDLGDDHDGIVEITEKDIKPSDHGVKVEPSHGELRVGGSFAKLFGLDDTIIDIENKMFTHRPDLFGQLGVAREISAILQGVSSDSLKGDDTRFVNPDWYWKLDDGRWTIDDEVQQLPLQVFNDAPEGSPRFMAVAIDGVSVEPSPLWLRCELVRWGSKPINSIVDWTNYIMLLTAQPTHAYDYDKLRGQTLGVRMAREGEKVSLLNGKSYSLTRDDVVIADGEGAVGLAGVMGGGNSEVSADTKRIVLEVANFDMYKLRKTSMRYGLFTDALTRFNKGQSPLQNDRIINRLLQLLPGRQVSPVYDLPSEAEWSREVSVHGEVLVSVDFINQRLGLELSEAQISSLLRRANFAVYPSEADASQLSITAPCWRTDIELPEDVVEEVGRLYGFDKLPHQLPSRSTKPTPSNPSVVAKSDIRQKLTDSGANEVLTYSFVHEDIMTKAGQNPEHAYKLTNALSPDLQYYRLGISASLIDKVHMNIKAGHDKFALYEIGKTHFVGEMDESEPDIPNEDSHVALVVAYADKVRPDGSPYYSARRYLERVVDMDTLDAVPLSEFDIASDEWGSQLVAPYEPKRSVVIVRDNQVWGVIGEYRQSVKRNFKLPKYTAGFEVHTDIIDTRDISYRPLSRFPSSHQDISLQVDAKVSYANVLGVVESTLAEQAEGLRTTVEPISIYQAEGSDQKTVTLRVTVNNPEATLTDATVNQLMDSIAQDAAKSLAAKRI